MVRRLILSFSHFRQAAALVGSGLVLACSLAVDTSDVTACPVGQKRCSGVCVGLDVPGYGCDSEECEPCGDDPVVIFTCSPDTGDCRGVGCLYGQILQNGAQCIRPVEGCGDSMQACPPDQLCENGQCVLFSTTGAAGAGGAPP